MRCFKHLIRRLYKLDWPSCIEFLSLKSTVFISYFSFSFHPRDNVQSFNLLQPTAWDTEHLLLYKTLQFDVIFLLHFIILTFTAFRWSFVKSNRRKRWWREGVTVGSYSSICNRWYRDLQHNISKKNLV